MHNASSIGPALSIKDEDITESIPPRPHRERDNGTFSRSDFKFDKERNVYVCPAGKLLMTPVAFSWTIRCATWRVPMIADHVLSSQSVVRKPHNARFRATSTKTLVIMPVAFTAHRRSINRVTIARKPSWIRSL